MKYVAEWPTKYSSTHRTAAAAIRVAKRYNKAQGVDPQKDDNFCSVRAIEEDGQYESTQQIWPTRSNVFTTQRWAS
jgi:hypothetical protein